MQELVYKLVPGLQAREEESRRAFGISEKNDSGEKQILKKEENNVSNKIMLYRFFFSKLLI